MAPPVMLASVALLAALAAPATADLDVMAQWALLDFDKPFNFPAGDPQAATSWVFTGMEVGWDKIYLATPRFQPGLPSTLNWIPRPTGPSAESPKLQVR